MVRNLFYTIQFICSFLLSTVYAQTTAIPDQAFEQALIDLGIDSDGTINGGVASTDIEVITYLDVSGKYIQDLTGIKDFLNLEELYCQNNYLLFIDLSQNVNLKKLDFSNSSGYDYEPLPINIGTNINLRYLNCSGNRLTGINVGHIASLDTLICSSNKIQNLNVGQNTNLQYLNCDSNLLTQLSVTQNAELTFLHCSGNQLSSLDVSKNENLINLSFSGNQLTTIDLSKNEDLEYLYCSQNAFSNLDLSSLNALKVLYCINNYLLTGLELSANSNLEIVNCYSNTALTSLNITGTSSLVYLNCRYNKLGSLDLSENILLETLKCNSNQITELDLSQNTNLNLLWCHDNMISSLDLSQNQNLEFLRCSNNLLESLNVKNGNNSAMTGGYIVHDGLSIFADGLDARSNPLLVCIDVDDEVAANAGEAPYDGWFIDAIVSYSEDCSTLGIDDELFAQTISLYPNPVSNILIIDSEIPLVKVEIFSILGKKVKEISSNFNMIPVDNLSFGVYIVKMQAEKDYTSRKIIKL